MFDILSISPLTPSFFTFLRRKCDFCGDEFEKFCFVLKKARKSISFSFFFLFSINPPKIERREKGKEKRERERERERNEKERKREREREKRERRNWTADGKAAANALHFKKGHTRHATIYTQPDGLSYELERKE